MAIINYGHKPFLVDTINPHRQVNPAVCNLAPFLQAVERPLISDDLGKRCQNSLIPDPNACACSSIISSLPARKPIAVIRPGLTILRLILIIK